MSDFITQREALALINKAGERAPDMQPLPVFDPHAADPREAQLIELFRLSDERGQALLLRIGGIHATCYPKVKS